MESLCAHCADRGFPCTTFWPAYPPRRLSEKTLLAMICAISKSAAISRRDAAKTLTGFASAGRQRGRDGLRTWDASPAKADRTARTRREISVRMFQARPSGRREALGSVWGGAGRNRPPLHRGRRFRADRSPLPRTEMGRPAGRTREGMSAPTARSRQRPLRGSRRSEKAWNAKRAGRSRATVSGERPALRRAALERTVASIPSPGCRSWRPSGSALSLGKRVARQPERPTALVDRGSCRLPRRQAVSCRARARSSSKGTGQPDASILYGLANRRSSPLSRPNLWRSSIPPDAALSALLLSDP